MREALRPPTRTLPLWTVDRPHPPRTRYNGSLVGLHRGFNPLLFSPLKPEAEELKSQVSVPGLMIQELESSPVLTKRQTPSQSPSELTATLPDSDWTKNTSPRRKKEKDVFKFLKESDPNYTIRRQQLQMNLILEKNQTVKKVGGCVRGLVFMFLSKQVI